MAQLVTLYLYSQPDDGVQAQVAVTNSPLGAVSMVGTLPSYSEVLVTYQTWRSTYLALRQPENYQEGDVEGISSRAIVVESVGEYAGLSGHYASSPETCDLKANAFKTCLNQWLLSSTFVKVRELLSQLFSQKTTTRFVICTDSAQLQQLPWALWDLLQPYPAIEVAISGLSFRQRPEPLGFPIQSDTVQILAILGDDTGINIEKDRQFLADLPHGKVEFLPTPNGQVIHDRLWEQPRDILFFAGHSASQGDTGTLRINKTETLSLDKVEHALERLASNGLTLAIFNSCDGLGLARRLAKLTTQVPYIIVMRESIPDAIAQEFLKYFLETFSLGKDFHEAVREARERLERLNTRTLPPYGDWMPVIWQNPIADPPVWPQPAEAKARQRRQNQKRLTMGVALSSLSALLTLGLRWTGLLQELELNAYDRFLRSQPATAANQTTLIIKITEAELDPSSDRSISNDDLETLLKKLYEADPRIVGLDIFRDFPVAAEYRQLAEYFANSNQLITICGVDSSQVNKSAVAPSPMADPKGIGFSDIVNDTDRVYRRHLLAIDPQPGPCQTDLAFATLLAIAYLETEGFTLNPDSAAGVWTWGNRRIPLLKAHQGGYHKEDMGGDSILLNYYLPRLPGESSFQTVTLDDVLRGNVSRNLIQDRMVLIGTDATSIEDETLTPLLDASGKKLIIPGVVYHAHAANQLIDMVLGNRNLIRPLPLWSDTLILLGLAATGCALGWRCSRLVRLGFASGIAVITVYGSCWIIYVVWGLWLPVVPGILTLMGGAMGFTFCDRVCLTSMSLESD